LCNSVVNQVRSFPVGRAEPKRSAARPSREDGRTPWIAGGRSCDYSSFPVVCSFGGYGVSAPFVRDYAGGNRSLTRACFHRLRRAASFHLATSRSHAGRP
jgi:hypothetical protein